MSKLLYEEETGRILGACFEVYKQMGCGFLESVYQECLNIELESQNIPTSAQKEIALCYKGRHLSQTYRPDFLCFEKIVVEIKAAAALAGEHEAQVMNYLRATGLKVGLLINFGHYPGMQFKRIVF